MALTAYCKKCNREVPPGDICPYCGTKLAKSATHAAWVLERRPAADWMCWNAVMRWLVPAGFAVLVLALVLEGLSGGAAAVERLFRGSFPLTLAILLLGTLLIVLAALLLQGRELMDYVIDSRGIHVTRYLPEPTAVKLLARLKSPGLLAQADPENPVLALETRDLAWKDVARVQLWPEKCYILFYAPAWWLRIPVRCTPFSWEDALYYVREKLGKKKTVDLPAHLRPQAEARPSARRSGRTAAGRPASQAVRPEPERAPAGEPWPGEPSGGTEADPWPEETNSWPGEDPEGMNPQGADFSAEAGEQMQMELPAAPEEND